MNARLTRRIFRPLSLAAALGSAALIAGLITLGTTPFSAPTASTLPIALHQVWLQDLNDAPCGVAESSPVEVTVDRGGPSVEVGDRVGELYAFHLADGSVPPGWSSSPPSASVGSGQGCSITGNDGGTARPVTGINGIAIPGNTPMDSTASVLPTSGGSSLFFGAGNAADPAQGGYFAYDSGGHLLWQQAVRNPPTDGQTDIGVAASSSIVPDGAGPFVFAGSLGQESYALNAADGSSVGGWPFFSADSVFSTAAVADLYGTGRDDIVMGGASTSGAAYGRHYQNGGHLRILNDHGGLICSADTNEEIDSSPAIGPILPDGELGIATGTGSYFPGTDQDTVKVYDTLCKQVWSDTLDGITASSPALADIKGNGQLAVIEGTNTDNVSGSVWALDAATGTLIWKVPVMGAVIGSVTTADLSGDGAQDVVVPTTGGLEILDGKTGDELVHVDDGTGSGGVARGEVYGFQNSPLVTQDPDGSIGITVAGYFATLDSENHDVQGMVQHFTVAGSKGSLADEAGGWPQFHHDPALTGYTGTAGSHLTGCEVPPAAYHGYLMTASDGGVFTFGGQQYCGSTGNTRLNKPIVGMAMSSSRGGYWLVAADGGVFSFGLPYYGSTGALSLNKPIIGMAATPDGLGYWLVGADGGIFTFGDAPFLGSAASWPGQTVVAMASTPDGQGYWEVTSGGTVFSFGDAGFFGDTRRLHLVAPIVDMTPDPATGGYWLVAANGGVFSFNAPFFGATGPIPLSQPIVGIQATDDGEGYWIVAADGGVFTYGDAPFEGSNGGKALNRPVVAIVGF